MASIKNSSGNYIFPSKASISDSSNLKTPHDNKVIITNTDAENGYPISSFTWLLFCKDQTKFHQDYNSAKSFQDFLLWLNKKGSSDSNLSGYLPISERVFKNNLKSLKSLTFNGKSL